MTDLTYGPNGWTPERLESLDGKTFLITGGNSGTGFQTSRILLSKNAKVVMLNRNRQKSNLAVSALKEEFGADADVSYILTDLSELENVRQAAKEVLKNVARIDALFCNAAIAQVPNRKLTADKFESQLGTNHFGHFVLCGELFDRIQKSKGRIVVVASLGYNMGTKTIQFDDLNWNNKYSANAAYSQSKLAQMMFAYELQDRIQAAKKNVEVLVCHPGSSATSLISTSGGWMIRMVWWLMTKSPLVQTAEKGAYPAVMCATEDGLEQRALYGPTGRMEFIGPVGRGTLYPHAYDKSIMSKLWDVSEELSECRWEI